MNDPKHQPWIHKHTQKQIHDVLTKLLTKKRFMNKISKNFLKLLNFTIQFPNPTINYLVLYSHELHQKWKFPKKLNNL